MPSTDYAMLNLVGLSLLLLLPSSFWLLPSLSHCGKVGPFEALSYLLQALLLSWWLRLVRELHPLLAHLLGSRCSTPIGMADQLYPNQQASQPLLPGERIGLTRNFIGTTTEGRATMTEGQRTTAGSVPATPPPGPAMAPVTATLGHLPSWWVGQDSGARATDAGRPNPSKSGAQRGAADSPTIPPTPFDPHATNNLTHDSGAAAGSSSLRKPALSSSAAIGTFSVCAFIMVAVLTFLLFGLWKVRRDPGRYGPRAADPEHPNGPLPARSRAAGLTRAVLDSFPVTTWGALRASSATTSRNAQAEPPEKVDDPDPHSPRTVAGDDAPKGPLCSVSTVAVEAQMSSTAIRRRSTCGGSSSVGSEIRQMPRLAVDQADDAEAPPSCGASEGKDERVKFESLLVALGDLPSGPDASQSEALQNDEENDEAIEVVAAPAQGAAETRRADGSVNSSDGSGRNHPGGTSGCKPSSSGTFGTAQGSGNRPSTSREGSREPEPEEKNECCAICTEPFLTGDEVRILPCFGPHHFHVPCIDSWLQISPVCPLCRQDLQPRSSCDASTTRHDFDARDSTRDMRWSERYTASIEADTLPFDQFPVSVPHDVWIPSPTRVTLAIVQPQTQVRARANPGTDPTVQP
ncbi:hypothetical protein ACQY0O_007408 [Thecaphora frezii]